MLTPSTLTIPQTGVGTCLISTTLVSGQPQLLQLSTTTPAGVQAFFSPPAVMVGTNCILTITVGGSVAPGTYPMTLNVVGPAVSHTVILTLIVTASDFSV